jgi:hypothetical protein
VVRLTTQSGRAIPLDNTPIFKDWDEIKEFKEGEPWKVEWGPMPSYVDIITEGSFKTSKAFDYMAHLFS